jgi:hypothetical protein
MRKVAFDARLFDAEKDINPRRNLQFYHRAASPVSADVPQKLVAFKRLLKITEQLKLEFHKEPGFADSYIRVLNEQLIKTLRIIEKDSNYAEQQPSMNSLNYLEEMMYSRYRLSLDNVRTMDEKQLRDRILSADPELLHLDPVVNPKEYSVAEHNKEAYAQVISKVLSAPSDGNKVITIKVSDNDKDEAKDFQTIIDTLTKNLDPILTKKLKEEGLFSSLEKKLLDKYKEQIEKKFEEKMEEMKEEMSHLKIEARHTHKNIAERKFEEEYDEDEDQDLIDELEQLDYELEKEGGKYGRR